MSPGLTPRSGGPWWGSGRCGASPAQQPRVAPALTAHCGADGVTRRFPPPLTQRFPWQLTAPHRSRSLGQSPSPAPAPAAPEPPQAAPQQPLLHRRGIRGVGREHPHPHPPPGLAQGCQPLPQLRPGLCVGTTRVRCPGPFRWGHPLPAAPDMSSCPPGEPQRTRLCDTQRAQPRSRRSLCDLGFPYRSPIWGSRWRLIPFPHSAVLEGVRKARL